MLGHSAHGLRFEAAPVPAVERAGQPELVRGSGGELLLFCISGALEDGQSSLAAGWGWEGMLGMPGYGVLQLYVSRDGGATWTRDRGLTLEGLEPGMVRDPEVVSLPDGSFRLYLIHLDIGELLERDSQDVGKPHRLITATSTDLRHWRVEGEAVRGPSADATVLCTGAACRMLCLGLDGGTSTDGGRTFTLDGAGPDKGFGPELTALPDGRLRLFYNGRAEGAPLLSQISADGGVSWAREPGTRAAMGLSAVSVLPTPGGAWLMAAQRTRADRPEQGGPPPPR